MRSCRAEIPVGKGCPQLLLGGRPTIVHTTETQCCAMNRNYLGLGATDEPGPNQWMSSDETAAHSYSY